MKINKESVKNILMESAIIKIPKSLIRRLEKDPLKQGSKFSVGKLVSVLETADDYYYNTGKALLRDFTYNTLKQLLKDKKPNHKYLKKIGAPIRDVKKKVKLPFFMPSLDKVKPDGSLEKWLQTHPGPYIVSDKLDGKSLQIIEKNKQWEMFSRGNGTFGGVLTQYVDHMKHIPKAKKGFALRLEGLIPVSQFKKMLKKDSALQNPRNTASGILSPTRKTVSQHTKNIKYRAYEIISPAMKPSMQMKKMKTLGFKVVAYKKFNILNLQKLTDYLELRKKKSKFEIDGLVITQDKKYTRTRSGNPDYSKSFKLGDEVEAITVTIIDIEWNASRHGRLNPRINIEPTKIGGVTVNWCTAHNAKTVKENKLGPGAKIKVIRSGDVIPKFMGIVKKAKKPQMPSVDYEWDDNGTFVYHKGEEVKEIKQSGNLAHFFKTIGIEDVKKKTLDKLYHAGFKDVVSIINVSKKDLLKIAGIKEKSANKILTEVKKSLQGVEMHVLMYASGCFGSSIGSRRLKKVYEAIPTMLKKKWTARELEAAIIELPTFKEATARPIAQGVPRFRKFYKSIKKYVKVVKAKKVKKASSRLEGERVCFTKFRDKELEKSIVENGGEVVSGVNKQTTILLTTDPSGSTSKLNKARDLGIKIMTPTKFMDKYKV